MSQLLRHPKGDSGKIHSVSAKDAGWSYVGFEAWRLAPGESAAGDTGTDEVILLLVEGKARLRAAGQDFGEQGGRMSVWEKTPPHSLYVPGGTRWEAEATTPCILAVCAAPAGKGSTRKAAVLGPDSVVSSTRGKGTNVRHIHNIAMEDQDVADSLLVTEVFTPDGNWSSYPPHRHDEDDFPRITYLEESYYHRVNPPTGFAVQRVFTEDGSLDETMSVRDHDVTLVPRGHHPCAAPYGHELYYLNVMAGPIRKWRFQNHPDFEWLAKRDA